MAVEKNSHRYVVVMTSSLTNRNQTFKDTYGYTIDRDIISVARMAFHGRTSSVCGALGVATDSEKRPLLNQIRRLRDVLKIVSLNPNSL